MTTHIHVFPLNREIAAPQLMRKLADIYFTKVVKNVEIDYSLSPRQLAMWHSQQGDHAQDLLRAVAISGLGQTMNSRNAFLIQHKFKNMSCTTNFGTLSLSKRHEPSIHSIYHINRRISVLPCSISGSEKLTSNTGKSAIRPLQRVCKVQSEERDGYLTGEGTIIDEQTLEKDLQTAIQEENYIQAAKIRDSLRFLQEDNKASVLAANARFYNCFRSGDLTGMQALWAKRDNVCCVHPGVSGISGYDLVIGSWEFVCAEYEFPIKIDVKDVEVHVKGEIGYVTCIEVVKTKGKGNWGRQFATNVFEKIDGQWFICIHHASYVDL